MGKSRSFRGKSPKNERNENQMKSYNFTKIRKKLKQEDHYNKAGIDNTARTFLYSIKENLHHQRRKLKFMEYSGYEPHY